MKITDLLAKVFVLILLCFSANGMSQDNGTILIEAESFDTYGGWFNDTQFMDQMGSPYLIAHGVGTPVANATTKVMCKVSGKYQMWVRTFDWVARWRGEEWDRQKRATGDAPGQFSILIDNKPVDGLFGVEGENWAWQKGPIVKLKEGSFELALKDLTGFDGRCDAVCFTLDKEFVPPNSPEKMKTWRKKLLGIFGEIKDAGSYELVVVGGGVAGMCVALQAARLGVKVALIQDRLVLGGNASSEICVNISGKLGFEPYPNIGNIVKEIQPDEHTYWHKGPFETGEPQDVKRQKLIEAEKNISLFLGNRVNDIEMNGYEISAVIAQNIKTGETHRVKGKLFSDCTGDANLGALAGADFVITENGHTSRTNLWFIHNTGKPTLFPKCSWALQLANYDIPKPPLKIDGWYWESGFNHHPINDGEYIRDWNFRVVYGAWDKYKNSTEDYKTYDIKWFAYISGTRESRRLMGDVILHGTEILEKKEFEDGCVPLSWRLDMHQPSKKYSMDFERDEFIATCDLFGMEESGYQAPYWMPYRCLYSRDVSNLFMAGRNISVTQSALGASRVMRTTGMMGEVVGKAASICIKHNAWPRDVYELYFAELKELMKE